MSAFARCLMISCGVLESVIAVIASSSTFQKPVTRAETRPRVTITPTSPPVRPFGFERFIGPCLRVADAEVSIELVQRRRTKSVVRRRRER